MKKTIIGFTGYKSSGKSHSAKLLKEFAENRKNSKVATVQVSFAKILKEICVKVFGYPEYFYDETFKEKEHPLCPGFTGRQILQHIGTEGFRFLNKDVWFNVLKLSTLSDVEMFEKEIASKVLSSDTELILFIDDLRFENEVGSLRKWATEDPDLEVFIVKILANTEDTETLSLPDTHLSEAGIPQGVCDYIHNNCKTEASDAELLTWFQKTVLKETVLKEKRRE